MRANCLFLFPVMYLYFRCFHLVCVFHQRVLGAAVALRLSYVPGGSGGTAFHANPQFFLGGEGGFLEGGVVLEWGGW